jgi:microcystin-dependent protein
MAISRRSYKGAPVSNSLSGGLAANATTINLLNNLSGWPTGSEPFFVVVDPGTAKEEKICVVYASVNSLTVVDPASTGGGGWTTPAPEGRGADDTIDRAHDAGATIYPVFTAREANDANRLVATYANQGGIVYQGASNPAQLAIGTAGHVLKTNSTATAPEWGQVGSAGIADGAITSGKIDDGAIVNADINASAAIALSKLATGALPTAITVASANLVNGTIVEEDLADGAVTSAKILNGTIALTDLATAVANALVPVGTITAYAGATAPTGWLLCDGTSFSSATYPSLYGILNNTATTPDFKGRFLIGDNASLTLLGTGGSTTIATTNLPAHSHAAGTLVNGASATGVTTQDASHTHTFDIDLLTSTVSHGHGQNGTLIGGTTADPDGDGTFTIQNSQGGNHSHGITDPTHNHTISGATAETGGAQAYYQPYGVVNYIIKHD